MANVQRKDSSTGSDVSTLNGSDVQTQYSFHLEPISVDTFEENRYSRSRYITDSQTEITVPAFTRSFRRATLANWTPHRHPEGGLYFVHNGRNRVFTDAYLYDDKILEKINACVEHIDCRLETKDLLDMEEIDIVLELVDEQPEKLICGYYLVDHSMRTIFWMDDFQISQLAAWKRVRGIVSESHINLILEHAYWLHCDLFPAARPFSPALISELRDTLVYSATDALTSPSSTIPFSVEDILKMLTLTDAMEKVKPSLGTTPSGVETDQGTSSALARLMRMFAHERVNHFHGEYAARLDRSLSVYGPISQPQQRYWMAVISPLLFYAPNGHLCDLRGLFMDEIISQLSWKRFMDKVLTEWQEMTLYASLILNANVGILAVPGNIGTSVAQIPSYISVCFALGSIILGLFLSRKYRPEAVDAVTAGPAFTFKKQCLGALEAQAMLFSLPYVFMMWAMTAFFSSFLIMAVEIGNIPTSATVLTTASVLLVAIAFALFSAYGWGLTHMVQAITRWAASKPPQTSTGRKPERRKVELRQCWRHRRRSDATEHCRKYDIFPIIAYRLL